MVNSDSFLLFDINIFTHTFKNNKQQSGFDLVQASLINQSRGGKKLRGMKMIKSSFVVANAN